MIKKIIHKLKNHTFITDVRRKIYVKRYIKTAKDNSKKYLIGLGKICLKYEMNLNNPKTFNEKINWYKINYHTNLMDYVVDKINAKEYVSSKGLNDIVIKTIGTYDKLSDINFELLPNKFVIKNTSDSGGVFICKNKTKINIKSVEKKLSCFNKEMINGVHWALENAYSSNNRIIVEELLDTLDGHSPADYKFFCFNGEPKFLFVATNRDTNVCFDFYDTDFKWINVKNGHPNSNKEIIKPKNFEKMLDICRILSKDFPQVRVDLYNINGKIYFGELTFYHFAGLTPFKPDKYDLEFGNYFDLPNK